MKNDRKWHIGPPPFVGWFNASSMRDTQAFRWWNGFYWSKPAYPEFSAKDAAYQASIHHMTKFIEWTNYWPKNAAPCIDPNSVKGKHELILYKRQRSQCYL